MKLSMMRRLSIAGMSLAVVSVVMTGCRSSSYAERGAATGGIVGGLTGAALAHHSGNAPGAALVGGALGSVVGAAIGDSIDQEMAQREALAAQQAAAQYAPRPVSSADVVTMVRSGVGEDVIIQQIQTHGLQSPLSASDIVALHQQGVSDRILNAMQQAHIPPVPGAPLPAPGTPPVVVHEYVPVPDLWHPPHYHYYRRPRRHVRWGVSVYH